MISSEFLALYIKENALQDKIAMTNFYHKVSDK